MLINFLKGSDLSIRMNELLISNKTRLFLFWSININTNKKEDLLFG